MGVTRALDLLREVDSLWSMSSRPVGMRENFFSMLLGRTRSESPLIPIEPLSLDV